MLRDIVKIYDFQNGGCRQFLTVRRVKRVKLRQYTNFVAIGQAVTKICEFFKMTAAAILVMLRYRDFYKIQSEKIGLKKCAEFAKMVCRIGKLRMQNFHFLMQNYDNPSDVWLSLNNKFTSKAAGEGILKIH